MVKSKKISYLAILSAISSAIYYFESFLPMPIPVPGARWGFSNFPVLLGIVKNMSFSNIIYMILIKSIMGSMFTGKLFTPTFWMGITGSLIGSIFMFYASKIKKFGIVGISEIGAFVNNSVQIIVAGIFIIHSKGIFWYYPFMVGTGFLTAFINASIVKITIRSVEFE
ncbi:hypothetical protein OSSY52_21850 [Tepiditoga spiralis]|uniref:Heptaprenyl diphosphate synthase subunit I n=1 Tax=Tepiditoga spiralis TaxID=2108365 RepID=A0A7G1G9U1_9BACT|nr:Gx transporter family protein [Tepiditoga spiralis]BBE32044.1 hypothetical protein OSSY52_21850 [Tepiditoga spiralis]